MPTPPGQYSQGFAPTLRGGFALTGSGTWGVVNPVTDQLQIPQIFRLQNFGILFTFNRTTTGVGSSITGPNPNPIFWGGRASVFFDATGGSGTWALSVSVVETFRTDYAGGGYRGTVGWKIDPSGSWTVTFTDSSGNSANLSGPNALFGFDVFEGSQFAPLEIQMSNSAAGNHFDGTIAGSGFSNALFIAGPAGFWAPPQNCNVAGGFSNWKTAYPLSQRGTVATLSGSSPGGHSEHFTPSGGGYGFQLLFDSTLGRADTGFGISAHSGDLAANNESELLVNGPLIPSCGIRLPAFDAVQLSQPAVLIVDPCTSNGNWTYYDNQPPFVDRPPIVGGHVEIDTGHSLSSPPTKGLVQFSAPGPSSWFVTEGYRFLEIGLRPNSSRNPLEIIIATVLGATVAGAPPPAGGSSGSQNGVYAWTVDSGPVGSFNTIRIDLMAPNGSWRSPAVVPVGETHTVDSRWRQTSSVFAVNVPLAEGDTIGLNQIVRIWLEFLASTGTYDLSFIRLVRDGNPSLSFFRDTYWFDPANVTPPTFTGCLAITDGRNSLEYWHVQYPSGTPFCSWLSEFVSFANSLGWIASYAPASIPWNYRPEALWLGGGGGIFKHGDGSPTYAIDLNASSPLTVKSQVECETFFPLPGCGDLLTNGGFGSTCNVAFWTWIRGRVHGVAVDRERSPVVGATVNVTLSPGGAAEGSGITDANGYYLTGAAYPVSGTGSTEAQHLVQGSGANLANDGTTRQTETVRPRHMARVSFDAAAVPSETAPRVFQDREGRLHRISVVSGDIVYRRSDTTVKGWAQVLQATSVGDVVRGSISVQTTGRIELLFERNNAGVHEIWACVSDGSDFSSPTLVVSNAYFPSIAIHPSENSAFRSWFIYDAGTSGPGKGHGEFRNSAPGSAWGADTIFKDHLGNPISIADGGLSNTAFAADGQGRLSAAFVVNGETAVSDWWSADQGATWNRTP